MYRYIYFLVALLISIRAGIYMDLSAGLFVALFFWFVFQIWTIDVRNDG